MLPLTISIALFEYSELFAKYSAKYFIFSIRLNFACEEFT